MTAIDLKRSLIQQIAEINDISFLRAIKTILEVRIKEEVLKLTPDLHNEIISSKKEIAKGLFIDNIELEKEIELWRKEK